jgi:putative flippase GtrA
LNLKSLLLVSSLGQFFRYYQAALVNTVFGFSLYAALVFFGTNRFAAQVISHIVGMCFNYFTYSRHVFRDNSGSKIRFVLSYAVSGGLNFCFLYLWSLAFRSAYIAGILATVTASLIMFFLLKYLVFVKKKLA